MASFDHNAFTSTTASAYPSSTFSNNSNSQDFNKLLKTIYYKVISSSMFIPLVSFLNSNLLNVKTFVSVVVFLFNYRKIKYLFKIYLIVHICFLCVYLYNRSIVKFINTDIPKLYHYMDTHGNVSKTMISIYNNILLNNLAVEDRAKVDLFVRKYVINGFRLVVVPLKQNIIKTLQDIENLIHGYVKI